jgi:hypothetical protein
MDVQDGVVEAAHGHGGLLCSRDALPGKKRRHALLIPAEDAVMLVQLRAPATGLSLTERATAGRGYRTSAPPCPGLLS